MLERDSKKDIIANIPLPTLCYPFWYFITYEQEGLEVYFLTIINPLLLISCFVSHSIIQSYLFTELCLEKGIVRRGISVPSDLHKSVLLHS